jgi:hypothetical protein
MGGLIVLIPLTLIPLYLWTARFLLQPVRKIAVFKERPVRFEITDLAALIAYVSIAMSVATGLQSALIVKTFFHKCMMAGCAVSFACSSWWIGVATLSRARIGNARMRRVYLLIAVPFAFLMPLVVLIAFGTTWLLSLNMSDPFLAVMAFFIGMAMTYAIFHVSVKTCHAICKWVARDCPAHQNDETG